MLGSTMIAGGFVRLGAVALLLTVASCGDLYFGDNPGHEFPKETGPLTVPPKALGNGTAP